MDPAHQSIYLRSDERVPFGAFASVMDAVKQSGITNVSIVTQPLETKGIGGEREIESAAGLARSMNSFLENGDHLERELTPEPIAGPAAGSLGLHLALAACLCLTAGCWGCFITIFGAARARAERCR